MSGESSEKNQTSLEGVLKELNKFADLSLAEKWDNVGLLIEPATPRPVNKILLTNDLTEVVMQESIEKDISLIISYHPPIFAPLKRVTQASWKERIVSRCLENKIAVFSPHTSWDAVYGGVNDWLAEAFSSYIQPNGKQPLTPSTNNDALYIATIIGSSESISRIKKSGLSLKLSESYAEGDKEICTAICDKEMLKNLKSLHNDINIGTMECGKNENTLNGMGRLLQVSDLTIADCVRLIKQHTGLSHVRLACAKNQSEGSPVKTIALVPGSGGSLLKGVKADLFVTGEMFHHDILDANHTGTSVILTNHSDSERGFLAKMAVLLNDIFKNDIKIEISSFDADPLITV
ncbi:NIF3-like protein 1 [Halyomorpha halys]|uniref:NIF3-like protein 1 n=1 Tax=Halyomorpha halys TaxID=286706 RepID=UPI0006D4E27D|nr:NIF3-like protein 1 isoform X2 [Halyomorpha halys]XP_014283191.1 NIF3-like protein 1 isoform X2 [Halyomorpha halys]XP_024214652.1 NIF3-like protein 1 isoform X2 [Halyomorpha halys]XP_024214653.1 NIF3-like protein 1 isoform X2 [Halyomorpha halys]